MIKTITVDRLLASYTLRYMDKDKELKSSELLIGMPLFCEQYFLSKFMIEGFFPSPKDVYGLNSLQAVGQSFRRLARYLQVLLEDGEIKPLIIRNFDECSPEKSISILDALATTPDYSASESRKKVMRDTNFEFLAAEHVIDFKSADAKMVPVTITLGKPWKKDTFWFCSYLIEGLMNEPQTVGAGNSLMALCLAVREIHVALSNKSRNGVFYERTFDCERTLREFKLKNYFDTGLSQFC